MLGFARTLEKVGNTVLSNHGSFKRQLGRQKAQCAYTRCGVGKDGVTVRPPFPSHEALITPDDITCATTQPKLINVNRKAGQC